MARSTSVRLDDASEAALDEMISASGLSGGEIIRSLLNGVWVAYGSGTEVFPTEVQALRCSIAKRDGHVEFHQYGRPL